MPQMMPMLWTIMLSLTMTMLLITIMFIYFLNLPMILPPMFSNASYKFINWNWSW
uniref:ATP synthase F0 subunit 8 n=1 Tax=Pheidole malinsii TaxID=615177 RepID=UPI00257FE28A|nr:ATP synthase F0 subunit 8 [Pheidole malinsii]WGV34134.1 ATP synthase F0 subunit 8 [Pheidole malinsii]